MGIRSIDYDNYDWELDDSPNNLAAVHTTGCGCCSRTLLVNDKNLDEIAYNMMLTWNVLMQVYSHLTLNWDELKTRAERFQKEAQRKLAE